ncbi:MAG: hypothetical protein KJ626_12670 [Verrucomicrobia bacterium]|nr:hypothetical protein [Verrucomicrobiota bacterium]
MGKKKESSSVEVNLDSFLDILTCLVGVLVLIIILTSIDASQTKLLIPTPMGQETDKRPVWIECRDNQLYLIDLDEIKDLATAELKRIADSVKGDAREMVGMVNTAFVETDAYTIDLSYSLIGQYALRPRENVQGTSLDNLDFEDTANLAIGGWFEEILEKIDPDNDFLSFLVRDDSFKVFKKARAVAWLLKIQCSYELLDLTDPIKFGIGGDRSVAQ